LPSLVQRCLAYVSEFSALEAGTGGDQDYGLRGLVHSTGYHPCCLQDGRLHAGRFDCRHRGQRALMEILG